MNTIIYPVLMMVLGWVLSIAPHIPYSWKVNLICWYYRRFTPTIQIDFNADFLTKMDVISFDSETFYLYVGNDRLKRLKHA
jgi:hypothetical protein